MWWREVDVAAPAADAWMLLTDTTRWQEWGPTVTSVRLDHPGPEIRALSTGAVRTPMGLWAPFAVTSWRAEGDKRSWSWRVAGIAATSHQVEALGADRCAVRFGVPVWAPAYLPVVEVGLRRLRRIAEGRPLG
ncbi:MAG: SRPBCC family protein [Nocardioides sp.]